MAKSKNPTNGKVETPQEAQAKADAVERQANASEIIKNNTKEKFLIDQKIKIIADELKALQAEGDKKDQKQIGRLKAKLVELKRSKKLQDEILGAHVDQLSTMDKEQVLLYDISRNRDKIKKIEQNLKTLQQDRTDLTKQEIADLKKKGKAQIEILKVNEKTATKAKEINRQYEMVLGTLGSSVTALKGMIDAAKAFGMAIMANPWMALTAYIALMVKGFVDLVKKSQELQKEMKLNLRDAMKMTEELNRSTFSFAFFIEQLKDFRASDFYNAGKNFLLDIKEADIKNTIKSYSELTGYILDVEKAQGFATQAAAIGATVPDMMQIANQIRLSTGGAMDMETSFQQIRVYAAEVKKEMEESGDKSFDMGSALEDAAKNTQAFSEYGKNGGKNILQAAIAARKLGLELSSLTKISDNLLDFESSIQSEMEASLMIGKQLNYNKARELALSGDLAGAAQDIASQIGGAAEFQKMNVMQRKSLAASMGLEVAEMEKLMSGGELEIKQNPLIKSNGDLETAIKNLNDTMQKTLEDKGTELGKNILSGSFLGLGMGTMGKKALNWIKGKPNAPSRLNPLNWGRTRNPTTNMIRKNSRAGYLKRGWDWLNKGTKTATTTAAKSGLADDALNVGSKGAGFFAKVAPLLKGVNILSLLHSDMGQKYGSNEIEEYHKTKAELAAMGYGGSTLDMGDMGGKMTTASLFGDSAQEEIKEEVKKVVKTAVKEVVSTSDKFGTLRGEQSVLNHIEQKKLFFEQQALKDKEAEEERRKKQVEKEKKLAAEKLAAEAEAKRIREAEAAAKSKAAEQARIAAEKAAELAAELAKNSPEEILKRGLAKDKEFQQREQSLRGKLDHDASAKLGQEQMQFSLSKEGMAVSKYKQDLARKQQAEQRRKQEEYYGAMSPEERKALEDAARFREAKRDEIREKAKYSNPQAMRDEAYKMNKFGTDDQLVGRLPDSYKGRKNRGEMKDELLLQILEAIKESGEKQAKATKDMVNGN